MNPTKKSILLVLVLVILLLGLLIFPSGAAHSEIPTPTTYVTITASPTLEDLPSPMSTFTPIPTMIATQVWVDPRDPNDWKNWDVIPSINPVMLVIYNRGLESGNNPNAFSKFGDCQSVTEFFLAGFDAPHGTQQMGEYTYLLDTVDWYSGSFARESVAVEGGLNIAGVQNPWPWQGKPEFCLYEETRAQCEIRVHNPSVALISYEELWDGDTAKYEKYLESLIRTLVADSVVPVLATTATNEDANLIVAQLAVRYNLPVWNFWAAIQDIPHKGISEDGFHLTIGSFYNFQDPYNMLRGWPNRNLTALMSLDAVRKGLTGSD